MKFECPYCHQEYDYPKAKPGQKAKCKQCGKIFHIPDPPIQIDPQPVKIIPDKITSDRIRQSAKSFFVHAWNRQPAAFRTGFITTLGVLSALMLTWYLYGSVFSGHKNTLDSIKFTLASVQLYPVDFEFKRGVFRGRALDEMKFSPDVNDELTYLSVWKDESNRVVGFIFKYYGDDDAGPSDMKCDVRQYSKSDCVTSGFKHLFNKELSQMISSESIKKEPTLHGQVIKYKNWNIEIVREKTTLQKSDAIREFEEKCAKILNKECDTSVYYYTVIAQNW